MGERVRREVLGITGESAGDTCMEDVESLPQESDENHLGTDMGVNSDGNKKSGNSNPIGDLLDHDTGRSKSRVGEVLTAVVVDDDTNSEIRSGDDGLTDVQGPVVVLRSSHFTDDVEEGGCTTVREDNGRDGCHTAEEGTFRVEGADVFLPRAGLRSRRRSVLNTDGDGDGQDGSHDGDEADPTEDRHLVECLDRGHDEGTDHCL